MSTRHVWIAITVLVVLTSAGTRGASQDLLRDALGDRHVADHWIYDDWSRAVETARAQDKPILAVFRCVP